MKLPWPVDALRESVAPALPGFAVEVRSEIDSTNAELMRRARSGDFSPVLLVAEMQTAGRGRMGRAWSSGAQAGDTLTFSLGMPLQMPDWSGLSLAVGLSLAQSLHPQIKLKWPNDLWLWGGDRGRKLAGILIEAIELRYAVIGIGLNIAPRGAEGLGTPPAWMQEIHPGLDAPTALHAVMASLVRAVLQFQTQGFAPLQSAWAGRDVLAGRAVVLSDGTEGEARGVDERGALLVHTLMGLKKITSAEVSVRPARPSPGSESN